jgi:hypothetical protein
VDEYGAVTRLDGSHGDQLLVDSEFSLIAFAGDASPIVLIEEEIIAFSDLLMEAGRLSLSEAPAALTVDGMNLVLFFEDWTGENSGFRADTVPLETLGLLPNGEALPNS